MPYLGLHELLNQVCLMHALKITTSCTSTENPAALRVGLLGCSLSTASTRSGHADWVRSSRFSPRFCTCRLVRLDSSVAHSWFHGLCLTPLKPRFTYPLLREASPEHTAPPSRTHSLSSPLNWHQYSSEHPNIS